MHHQVMTVVEESVLSYTIVDGHAVSRAVNNSLAPRQLFQRNTTAVRLWFGTQTACYNAMAVTRDRDPPATS